MDTIVFTNPHIHGLEKYEESDNAEDSDGPEPAIITRVVE
jgi:hypothetical protein